MALGVGDQDGCTLVDAIDFARHFSAIEEELDGVAWTQSVVLRGDVAMREEPMLGSSVSEESLGNVFETGLSAAGVLPNEHFGEVQQFVFHDPAKPFTHVVAGDPANQCGLFVRPCLPEQLAGDCNLKVSKS